MKMRNKANKFTINTENVMPSISETKRAKSFVTAEFHDSHLISIDFRDWFESISIVLYTSETELGWRDGRFLQITFYRLLQFDFEVACLGEFGGRAPAISNVIMSVDSDLAVHWRGAIHELGRATLHYPQGIKSINYKDVYHFQLFSPEFARNKDMSKSGFDIVCRDFEISDITDYAPAEWPRPLSSRIESV